MAIGSKIADYIEGMIDKKVKKALSGGPKNVTAKVEGIDGNGVIWVRIPGSSSATPVKRSSVEVSAGDTVTVTVGNNRAIIDANISNPSAGLERVVETQNTVVTIRQEQNNFNTYVTKEIVAGSARIGDLEADTAKIHNLTADELTATTAYIKELTSEEITAANIVADHATVNNLDATYATIEQLEANYIDANTIEAGYLHADMSNADVAWITNGTIANGAISDAMINTVSANKLTAGTIDASKINVANLMADNLIVRMINGQPVLGGYALIDPSSTGYSSKNPHNEGWYEISNGAYVVTSDTSPVNGKAYYALGTAVMLYDQAYINSLADQLNGRIDGTIETFTGTDVPTLVNYPYTNWYKPNDNPPVDTRDEHVGDIYYVINAGGQSDGYCYRFAKSGSGSNVTYSWVLIKDSDVTAALAYFGDMESLEGEYTVASFITHTNTELSNTQQAIGTIRSDIGEHSNYTTNTVAQQLYENSATITSLTDTVLHGGESLISDSGSVDLTAELFASSTATANGTTKYGGEQSYQCSGTKYIRVNFPTLTAGDTYTFSFDATSNAARAVYVTYNGVSKSIGTTSSTTGTWTRFSYTFEAVSGQNYILVRVNNTGSTNTYTAAFKNFKLEYGKLATPYEMDVFRTANTVNSIKQTTDSNTASISSLETVNSNNGLTSSTNITSKVNTIEQNVNGITTRVTATEAQIKGQFATCSTGASTQAKVATITPTVNDWALYTGATITVKFTDKNTNTAPTLNVNGTGAKSIRNYNAGTLVESEYKWPAGSAMTFTYDGTYWRIQDSTELTRLAMAESQITQNANNIELKVSEADVDGNYVIGKINLDATTATISASRVNIEGAAIFTSGRLSQTSLDNAYDANGAATAEANKLKAVYGTSSTGASTQTKAVTCANFALYTGASITVKFTYANTYTSAAVRLNVNSTGNKDVYVAGAQTSSTNMLLWGAGASIEFTYDGTYWVVTSDPQPWYGTCSIGASTAAKTTDITGAVVCKGATFSIQMSEATSVANPTLNVSSTGAKAIYIGGSRPAANSEYNWTAGATVDFVFDGQYYRGGDAAALAKAKSAQDTATSATTKAEGASSRVQRIYYRTNSASNKPSSGPTTWLSTSGTGYGNWSLSIPPLVDNNNNKYAYLYTCVQVQTVAQQAAGTTCTCTAVLLDETTTVIDGGSIIAGSVAANKVNFADATGNQLKLYDPNAPTSYQTLSADGMRIYGTGHQTGYYGSDGLAVGEDSNLVLTPDGVHMHVGENYDFPYFEVKHSPTKATFSAVKTVDVPSGGTLGTISLKDVGDVTKVTVTKNGNTTELTDDSAQSMYYTLAVTSASSSSGIGGMVVTTSKRMDVSVSPTLSGPATVKVYYTYSRYNTTARIGVEDTTNVLIDSEDGSLRVYDQMESVASLGKDGSRIGKSDESHMELDYHSLKLVDKEGNTYFHVSDLRDSDGYAEITDRFIGDGSTTRFELNFAVSSMVSATVDGVETDDYTVADSGPLNYNRWYITFSSAPGSDDSVVVVYNTGSSSTKAYTLGKRNVNSTIGAYSYVIGAGEASGYFSVAENLSNATGKYSHAEGYDTIASGQCSHAEGGSGPHVTQAIIEPVVASGAASHAEGRSTTASGAASHAEGEDTVADGNYSHAGNKGTTAGYDYQTAIGKYNDNKSTNLFEIGNGTSSTPSNAFEVDTSGNVNIPSGSKYKINGTNLAASDVGAATSGHTHSYLSSASTLFQVTSESATSSSISSGSAGEKSVTVSKSGYYPLGVVGFAVSQAAFVMRRCYLSARSSGSATVYWNVRNVGSSAATADLSAHVLWVKTSA